MLISWRASKRPKSATTASWASELGLFMLREEGPGFPFFLPKGMALKNTLHGLLASGPQEIRLCGDLHAHHPQPAAVGAQRPLGPLQGQHVHHRHRRRGLRHQAHELPRRHAGLRQRAPFSYRDLPLRVGELGLVHRHELSGALHGLFRVRCFSQDDAHLCS